MTEEEQIFRMLYVVMAQYAFKYGLNEFKERGEEKFTKELTQLHVLEKFVPVDATKLTKKQQAEAVVSLMFLKEKLNRGIKGQIYANKSNQWEMINK